MHDDLTGKFAALGLKVADTVAQVRHYLAGPNPFQGPGAEEAWKRLLAQPSRVVSREEMIRRAQEQAAAKK